MFSSWSELELSSVFELELSSVFELELSHAGRTEANSMLMPIT